MTKSFPSRFRRAAHGGTARIGFTVARRGGNWLPRAVWMALLVFGGIIQSLAQPRMGASLDRDTISLGESATLSLQFEGAKPAQAPAIQAPPNLAVQYQGQSTEFRMLKGQTSFTLKFTYRITATRAGDYTIPAPNVLVDGQRLTAQPLKLKVLPQDASNPESSGVGKYAFLRMIIPKTSIYLGEVLPVEIQLYVTAGEQLQIPQVQSEGFSFGPTVQGAQNQNPPKTQLGNSIYNVLSFRMAATPVKTGTLVLGPAQCSLVIHIPVARRGRDPFDDIFDFGPRVQRQQVTLTSEPVRIEVLPLPSEGRPPGFSGTVGTYDWVVSASPTNVMTGDPITLRVQFDAEGALDALLLPQQEWREFKTYPPNSKLESADSLGIKGVKVFEQVIIPQNTDVSSIPALTFSFFDPSKKTYRTLSHPPIPISVRPTGQGQPQPTVMAGTVRAQDEGQASGGLAHIKPYLGQVTVARSPLVMQPWFLFLQGVPFLVWLGAVGWRRRQEMLAANPRRRRRMEVAASARRGLGDLKKFADQNRPDEFFATVFRLLQERLGELLDQPASGITESVLDDRVRALGGGDNLISRLHELFQACNQARYAGEIGSRELNTLLPKVESALRELQSLGTTHGK